MTKSTNKKSSTKPPKSSGGLGGSDYKDQESAARALHRVIQNLDATVGSLARNFQSIGAGNKDIAKQIASTVVDARSLNNAYDYTVTVTSKVNELQQVSNKWYSDRFNIATDLLGLSDAEALNLDIALSKGKDRNDESLKGLDIQKRLSKLSDEDRKRAESYLDLRKKYFAQEKNQTAALTVLTNSQIQRVQTAQIKADLAQQAAKADFVSRIKDEIKSNELSNEAIELRFKQSQIEKLISELEKDGTEAGKAALKALQDERKELADAYETRLEIDEVLRKQTQELKKQEVLHRSIDNLLEKSRGLLGDEGEEVLEIGKAIKDSLVSPMALVGALIGNAVEEFGKIGRLGRDFLNTTGLTVDQTEHLRHYAHDLSLEFRAQGVQLKDVLDAQAALVDQYGTVNRVTDEATEKVTLLGKAFGIPAQASAGVLYQLQKSTGASAKVAGNVAALGANFAKAAGVAPTAVFQDISQSSEQIAQYFKGTPADLMRTAVEARRLGLTLGKVADISKALLNFESSIEDQMGASVLLGREINLDKARQLAMEGKIQEAAEETLSQIGSLADFNKMNAIQKEAIAKAAGMTVGDLQQSLEKQEAMKNMTAEQRAEYEKGLASLKSQNMTAAEKLLLDQRNQLTQEKIADAVAKISDIFANVILPVLEPIFDLISGIFSFVEPALPYLKTALQIFLGWKAVSFILNTNFFKMRGLFGSLVAPLQFAGKGISGAYEGTKKWIGELAGGTGTTKTLGERLKSLGGSIKSFFMGKGFKEWGKEGEAAIDKTTKAGKGFFGKLKEWMTGFSFSPMEKKADDLAQKMQESVTTAAGGAAETLQDKAKGKVEEIVADKKESVVETIQTKAEEKGKEKIESLVESKKGDAVEAIQTKAGDKSEELIKSVTGKTDDMAKTESKMAAAPGKGIKQFFTNLASGLKAMGKDGVGKGILNTALAGPALLIFTAAAPGLIVLSIFGKGIEVGLKGLAKGLSSMGNPAVALGAGILSMVALSLGAGMLMLGAGVYFAAKGMAELAAQFKEMQPGQILATTAAFIGFGFAIQLLAAAGVTATAGVIGLAAITGAIIGIGYAVNLAAPGITQIIKSFGELVNTIGGDKLKSVGAGLISLAGGIGVIAIAAVGALISLPAMALVAVGIAALGTAANIAGSGFTLAASGIQTITTSLQNLTNTVTEDSLTGIGNGLLSVAKGLGAIGLAGIGAIPALSALALAGPAISAVGSIFGGDESEPRPMSRPATTTPSKTTTKEKVETDNTELIESNKAILAKLDQLINVIANAKGEIKINNSVMGEWIGLGTARNYKAVR